MESDAVESIRMESRDGYSVFEMIGARGHRCGLLGSTLPANVSEMKSIMRWRAIAPAQGSVLGRPAKFPPKAPWPSAEEEELHWNTLLLSASSALSGGRPESTVHFGEKWMLERATKVALVGSFVARTMKSIRHVEHALAI